jgi:hypothetical protein
MVVVMKSSVFWDMTPCSPLKVSRAFLAMCFILVSYVVLSSTPKMEVTCYFQFTTWRVPEDRTLLYLFVFSFFVMTRWFHLV